MTTIPIVDGNSALKYFDTEGSGTSGNPYRSRVVVAAVGDGASADPFSRLRIAGPGYRFDSQLTYTVDSDLWDTSATGASTVAHDATERLATLTAGGGATDTAILQSHYHAPYTPGRGQLVFITGVFGSTPAAGTTRRMGYFDGTNGVYLEQTSAAVNLVLKSGTALGTQTVAQASWNIDPLTGSGVSGITLDLTKTHILVIDMQALYVGRVRVGFDIGGVIVYAHQFTHANSAAGPYIQVASLPVRYEISKTSGAGTATLKAVCATVISEGGDSLFDMDGRVFSAGNGTSSIGVTTRRPVFSIQVRNQLNSINNVGLIIPKSLEVLVRTNDCYLEIVRNGTLTGASFAAVNTTRSLANFDVAANAISGGDVIFSTYVPASAQARTGDARDLGGKVAMAYSHLLGVADTLSVVATSRTGTSDVHASLVWKEIR